MTTEIVTSAGLGPTLTRPAAGGRRTRRSPPPRRWAPWFPVRSG